MPSVTQTIAARHPHKPRKTRGYRPKNATTGKPGHRRSKKSRALARGTRKHAAIARLVGKTVLPPKSPRYVQWVFAAFKAACMTVLASEVKYTSLGETGIIDLVVRGPRGTCVVEVKTIGLKKAAWEAQMQRDPQGWYSTNKNRATAQARRYAQRGPYVHSKPYVLYVFPDCVTLVDVS